MNRHPIFILLLPVFGLILLILITSCTQQSSQSEVVPANGYDVLLNYRPVFGGVPGKTLLAEDVLVIDEKSAGLPPSEFIASISDIMAGANGEIVLLDWRIQQVFVFDKEGQYLRTFGRQGFGPGEFNQPWRLPCLNRNTVSVAESMTGQVNIFDLNGTFIKRLSFPFTLTRCIAPDPYGGYFLSGRAFRKPGESGDVNGTILYRLDQGGDPIPFNLTSGKQDTLEIARYIASEDDRFFHRITNLKSLLGTPDGSVLVAGLNYTFYRVSGKGIIAAFRRVGEPVRYPGWYLDALKKNWEERGARGDPPKDLGFFIGAYSMAVDERGYLWVIPYDGVMWSRASSRKDMGRDGVVVLDEFSPDGKWQRQILVQLPKPYLGMTLTDAAHGFLYGIVSIGDPEEEIRMPIRIKRP